MGDSFAHTGQSYTLKDGLLLSNVKRAKTGVRKTIDGFQI